MVITTTIHMHDGETWALEGLCSIEQLRQAPPLLGDLPIIGRMFRDVLTLPSDSRPLLFLSAQIMK